MALDRKWIGHTFSYPVTDAYEVGREMIRKFADAIGDSNPLYRDREAAQALGHRDVLAPPTFLTLVPYARVNLFDIPELGIDKTRGLHAEHKFTHHRPVCAGERVVLSTAVADIRPAGRHEILELLHEARDPSGELLSTINHLVLFRGDADAGQARAPVAIKPADTEFDTSRFPTQRYEVRQLDLLKYSGASGEYEPIHWSKRAAHAAGLPGVIAHGMFTMTKVGQALSTWFGDSALIREFGVRFASPLVVHEIEPATLSVVLTGHEVLSDGLIRVRLEANSGEKRLLKNAVAVVKVRTE